jgi:hypothetical protein
MVRHLFVVLRIDFEKERTGLRDDFFLSFLVDHIMIKYIIVIYLDISQAMIKRNCQNWSLHSKVTSLPKTLQPLQSMGSALGLSMIDYHKKILF